MRPSAVERLRIATLCLIEALRRDEIESIEPLMRERDLAIAEIEATGDPSLVELALPLEHALREAMESEMAQVIESFHRHFSERQAQSAYRGGVDASVDLAA